MLGLSAQKIDFDTLRRRVELRLCELGHLEPNEFPVTQREVVRGGEVCGFYFCLHGPRSVKLTAICDLPNQSVIYYGSDGVRRESVTLPMKRDLRHALKAI